MNKRVSVVAITFALGMVLLPAFAGAQVTCRLGCNCSVSCSQICKAPKAPDQPPTPPGDLVWTCGEWGVCSGGYLCSGMATVFTSTINGASSGDTLILLSLMKGQMETPVVPVDPEPGDGHTPG
jgi:hypothetical protein